MDGWFHVLHYAIALIGLWLAKTAAQAAYRKCFDKTTKFT